MKLLFMDQDRRLLIEEDNLYAEVSEGRTDRLSGLTVWKDATTAKEILQIYAAARTQLASKLTDLEQKQQARTGLGKAIASFKTDLACPTVPDTPQDMYRQDIVELAGKLTSMEQQEQARQSINLAGC